MPIPAGRISATCQDDMIQDEIIQASMEADKANDKMAQQVECLLAEHPWLSWEDDGSPMFRVEKHVTKDGRDVVALGPAPATPHRWKFAHPELSKWTASNWDKDPLIKLWAGEDT